VPIGPWGASLDDGLVDRRRAEKIDGCRTDEIRIQGAAGEEIQVGRACLREAMDAQVALGQEHDSGDARRPSGIVMRKELRLPDPAKAEVCGDFDEEGPNHSGRQSAWCASSEIGDPMQPQHGASDITGRGGV
jgi:hypothetical protein